MSKDNKVMFQFRNTQGLKTVDDVRLWYGFRPEEMDAEFGLVAIDPDDNLYAVLVTQGCMDRIGNPSNWEKDTGFFSNPAVKPTV